MRILVLCSDSLQYPNRVPQPHGLIDFREELQSQLGLQFDIRTGIPLDRFPTLVDDNHSDALFLLINWDYPAAAVVSVLADLARVPSRPPVVFLDQSDQTCSPFFGVLPQVDLFLKAQVLRDLETYSRHLPSGYIFTEYLSKELGYDLQDWEFGSTADTHQLSKIQPGWNLGVTRRVRKLLLLSRICSIPWRARPFDFHCRLAATDANALGWYTIYRQFALQSLREAARGRRCTGWTRVSYRKYLLEIAASRIVFSPFGWGEVCYRDYEAIALGALLVKPSMDHLVTYPDIFVPYETYLPVRWDLSDLEDKCRWSLAHPTESKRIVSNARRHLHTYMNRGGLAQDMRRALAQVGYR